MNRLGGGETCAVCGQAVYAMEKLVVDGKFFHKTGCFECALCKKTLFMGNYQVLEGKFLCKTCFKDNNSLASGLVDPKFECEYCHEKFVQRSLVIAHQRDGCPARPTQSIISNNPVPSSSDASANDGDENGPPMGTAFPGKVGVGSAFKSPAKKGGLQPPMNAPGNRLSGGAIREANDTVPPPPPILKAPPPMDAAQPFQGGVNSNPAENSGIQPQPIHVTVNVQGPPPSDTVAKTGAKKSKKRKIQMHHQKRKTQMHQKKRKIQMHHQKRKTQMHQKRKRQVPKAPLLEQLRKQMVLKKKRKLT